MQTIVNLVSAGLGLAWVPESVMQFRRLGVVYRTPDPAGRRGPKQPAVPMCETSMVWLEGEGHPALERFVDFVRGRMAGS